MSRGPARSAVFAAAVAGLLVVAGLTAQNAGAQAAPHAAPTDLPASVGRELLNSERIEQAFGSYGIDVLKSDASLRISNLYSDSGGTKVCRTFAVVRYPSDVDPRFAAEHAAILAGASIGATFASGGWTVVKTHRYLGEVAATPRLASLMGRIGVERLAVDVYELDVVKNGARLEYAAIAEVHHPDYLGLGDLERIYDPFGMVPRSPDRAVRQLLDVVAGYGQP
jgi:hypothetical protein